MQPLVSIIIPVYNVEKYLRECLDSAISQTLSNIEIICINDASTDSSLSILEEYKKNDSRLKVFSFSMNHGTQSARKKGVEEAKGKYIMFLDPDDVYYPVTCEVAYRGIENGEAEIFHFGTDVMHIGKKSFFALHEIRRYFHPYHGCLHNDDIFLKAFGEKKFYNSTLWDKIYMAELCKEAFRLLGDISAVIGQDIITYFVLSLLAKKYIGDSTLKLYGYRYGVGISTVPLTKNIAPEKLKEYCRLKKSHDRLKEILITQHKAGIFFSALYRKELEALNTGYDVLYVCNFLFDVEKVFVETWFDGNWDSYYLFRSQREAIDNSQKTWAFKVGSFFTYVPRLFLTYFFMWNKY